MLEKIKSYQNHPWVRDFRDIRTIGFAVFGVLVLLVSWSGVTVIETNYKLERQMAKLQQQNGVLSLQNQNDKLKNQYYTTNDYLELQARQQFGKAAPGETVLLVPKNVALAHTIDIEKTDVVTPAPAPQTPKYQQNFQAWRDFLFKRALPPADN
jgi:cell division protein FtsB